MWFGALLLVIPTALCDASKNSPKFDHYGDAGLEANGSKANQIPTRFDYRQTFKNPIFASANPEPDLPYFKKSGAVMIGRKHIRIVPSLPDHFGLVWCETPNKHKEWMVEFSFSISGRGVSGGAGFALWYTKDLKPPTSVPDFYGHVGTFQGLAVVFDTADAQQNRMNPFIYAIENDGTKTKADFTNYGSPSVHKGACFREYRNTPDPVWGRLIYKDGTLELDVDIRQHGMGYTNCFKTPINLPVDYHFGISAATSSSATDDHDIHSFETYELRPGPKQVHLRPHEQEDKNAGKEFKMDENLQHKIKEYEEKTDHILEKDEPEIEENLGAWDAHAISKIQENQFHILEGLNIIENKIGATPQNVPPVSKNDQRDFSQELAELRATLRELKTDLKTLHQTTAEIKESTMKLLKTIDDKIGVAGDWLRDQHIESQNTGALVRVVVVLVGVALVITLVKTCYKGKEDARTKKFV